MSKIKYETFDGIYPAMTPRNLPALAAQVAENVNLLGKRLDPWKIPLLIQGLANSVTIYPWRRGGATEWLSWATDVDVAQSPLGNDPYERIYITDGVKPYIRGWQAGAMVQKYMERPTASAPTAVAADRTGFGAAEMATVTAKWVLASGTINYTQIAADGTTTQETSSLAIGTEYIGTVVSRTRDRNTGAWTLEFSFPSFPLWFKVAPAGTRFTDISATLTGSWVIALNGTPYSIGGQLVLNDGASQFGTALVSGVLPTPGYTVGRNTVTWAPFTANVQFIPSFDDSGGIRFVYYRRTLVDDWGMEGPPSADSKEVTWLPGQKVVVSGLGALQGMSKWRLYRTAAGQTPLDDAWFFVAEGTGATYEDVLTDAEIGPDEMPTFENPPNDMKGIVMMPADFAAAFRGKEVLFSEPKYPWSYPTKYRLTMDWNVVGLGVNGNDLYVLTEGQPYVITGYHPESLNVAKLPVPQACASKKSIAALGPYIMYASPDGLVGISGGQARLLTKEFYDREKWQALGPTAMIGAVNDNRYFGFLATGAILFQPQEGADTLTTLTLNVTAAYADLIDDALYLVQASSLYKWNAGASNMTMRWRGKEVVYERRVDWNCGRMEAAAYPMTLRTYSQNVLADTRTVADNKSFRLPYVPPERIFSIEVEGVNAVNMVEIATSKGELSK